MGGDGRVCTEEGKLVSEALILLHATEYTLLLSLEEQQG